MKRSVGRNLSVKILVPDDDRRGGMQRSAINIAQALTDLGFDVEVLCVKLFRDGYSTDHKFVKAVSCPKVRKISFWWAFARTLRKSLRHHKESAWIAMGVSPTLFITFFSLGLGVRGLIGGERIHPPTEEHPWWVRVARQALYPRLNFMVFQSESSRAWIRDNFGLAEKKLAMIPNVVPKPAVAVIQTPSQAAPPLIVCVGRLTPQKGFDYALKVMARVLLIERSARLLIVGDGPELVQLKRLAESLGIDRCVDFSNSTRHLHTVWEKTDVFLFPSRYEGFPNVLAEAMAHGLPVVAFDCPTGPADLIQHGVNGFLVALGDIETSAECVIKILQDRELGKRLGTKACEVSARYSPEVIGRKWATLIENCSGPAR